MTKKVRHTPFKSSQTLQLPNETNIRRHSSPPMFSEVIDEFNQPVRPKIRSVSTTNFGRRSYSDKENINCDKVSELFYIPDGKLSNASSSTSFNEEVKVKGIPR